jgi:hypothetical protein
MSAIKPNKNFYNETMTHTPYTELSKSTIVSLYQQFMSPKSGKSMTRLKKKLPDSNIETVGFDTWFNSK